MSAPAQPAARVFLVDTRFQKLARRPGGVPRDDAIRNAQAVIDELKPQFHDWLHQELANLAAQIAQFSNVPSDPERFDRAMATCIHFRDVGTTMGFALLSLVAHQLCRLVEAIHGGAPCQRDIIDCYVNALALSKSDRYCKLTPEQVPELVQGLQRALDIASSGATPIVSASA